MKQILTRLSLILAVVVATLVPTASVLAAGGSISLTSSKGTVASGGALIVAVYVNGGGNNVNAVQADLAYPASKLQYVGFSSSGSAFEIGATSGGGDGTATLARGTTSPVNGSALLGTVTFKALVGSGSAAISVAGSSSLVSDGNSVPYASSGTSVNFGVAPAAAATTSTPAAKAAAAAAPAPPKDTTAPIVTALKATNVTPFSATLSWTTSEPADSAVDYGLDTTYGLSASTTAAVTAHSVNLSSSFLTPLSVLHYRVKSADAAGNVGTGTDQTLQLPGVPITVVVRGANGKPQAGATVTLDGTTATTDTTGTVIVRSGLGNKKLTTSYNGVTVQQPVTVAKSAKPLPPIQLDLSKKPLNHWMLSTLGLLVLVLALLTIDAALFGSKVLAQLTGIKFRKPQAQAVGATAVAAAAVPSHEKSVAAKKPSLFTKLLTKHEKLAAVDKPTHKVPKPEKIEHPKALETQEPLISEHAVADLTDTPTELQPAELAPPSFPQVAFDDGDLPLPSVPPTIVDNPLQPFTMNLEPIAKVTPAVTPKKITITHDAPVEPNVAADIAQRLKPAPKPSAPIPKKVVTSTKKKVA